MRDGAIKRRTRLLVVEDHPATARGLEKYLTLVGYEVVIATNASTARELAGEIEFDVLVSDLTLPDGTGLELLAWLKTKMPVRAIVFSAHDDERSRRQSKAAGFLDYVVKGTDFDVLVQAIERAAACEGLAPMPPSISEPRRSVPGRESAVASS